MMLWIWSSQQVTHQGWIQINLFFFLSKYYSILLLIRAEKVISIIFKIFLFYVYTLHSHIYVHVNIYTYVRIYCGDQLTFKIINLTNKKKVLKSNWQNMYFYWDYRINGFLFENFNIDTLTSKCFSIWFFLIFYSIFKNNAHCLIFSKNV